MKEGVACYQDFLRGLLDLTDNLVAGKVEPPPQVRRLDPDDPYLVVAADKGTATFSDYANAISKEYGFWLSDAFASGGSAGYDHKAMGITARGAWESVKRHFREIGVDTQTTPFTGVGIGDMSGDVFGTAVLSSTSLVAVLRHRQSPTESARRRVAERERLFKLPRSRGGLRIQARVAMLVDPPAAPSPLPSPRGEKRCRSRIHATPTDSSRDSQGAGDLLYNVGIVLMSGRRAKRTAVVDRANDSLRVNGRDLRCKVVAEGVNLG